jgi:hypothetical protein
LASNPDGSVNPAPSAGLGSFDAMDITNAGIAINNNIYGNNRFFFMGFY